MLSFLELALGGVVPINTEIQNYSSLGKALVLERSNDFCTDCNGDLSEMKDFRLSPIYVKEVDGRLVTTQLIKQECFVILVFPLQAVEEIKDFCRKNDLKQTLQKFESLENSFKVYSLTTGEFTYCGLHCTISLQQRSFTDQESLQSMKALFIGGNIPVQKENLDRWMFTPHYENPNFPPREFSITYNYLKEIGVDIIDEKIFLQSERKNILMEDALSPILSALNSMYPVHYRFDTVDFLNGSDFNKLALHLDEDYYLGREKSSHPRIKIGSRTVYKSWLYGLKNRDGKETAELIPITYKHARNSVLLSWLSINEVAIKDNEELSSVLLQHKCEEGCKRHVQDSTLSEILNVSYPYSYAIRDRVELDAIEKSPISHHSLVQYDSFIYIMLHPNNQYRGVLQYSILGIRNHFPYSNV